MKNFNTDDFSFIIHFGRDIRAELNTASFASIRNFQMQDIIIFKVNHLVTTHFSKTVPFCSPVRATYL